MEVRSVPMTQSDSSDAPEGGSAGGRLLVGAVVLALVGGAAVWAWNRFAPPPPGRGSGATLTGDRGMDNLGGTMAAGSGMEAPTSAWDPYPDMGPTRVRLRDLTGRCGITTVNHSGEPGVKEFLIEAVGVGAAWLDYDRDGRMDVYVPDGDVLSNYDLVDAPDPATGQLRPYLKPKSPRKTVFRDQLWRNNGDGTFTDVALPAGVADESWSFGATAADFDADGWTDLYVSNFGHNRLWRNNGNGTFTDVAPERGAVLSDWTWSTCSAVADFDGDGRLDLYVSAYADPSHEANRLRVEKGLPVGAPVESIPGRACRWKKVPAYCGPLGLQAQEDTFLHQNPDGTFEDRSVAMGFRAKTGPKYGFQAIAWDVNEDGLMDVYVANDSVESYLWLAEKQPGGGVRFSERAEFLGVKFGSVGNPQAGMGATVADINGDGLMDLFKTNFSQDYNNMYMAQSLGGGRVYFKDRGLQVLGQAVFYDLSWGCGWVDFDNDADLDLYVANGHVYKEVDDQPEIGSTYNQFNALIECVDAKAMGYREIGRKAVDRLGPKGAKLYAGDGMDVRACSRGAGFADANNDGRMDVLVTNMNQPANLLVNDTAPAPERNWAKIVLEQPGPNRDALGAVVEVHAAGKVQRLPVVRGRSFLGSDDPRVHVGLGPATTFEVRVVWPGLDRTPSVYPGLSAGKLWKLSRAAGEAQEQPLPTFAWTLPPEPPGVSPPGK